MIYSNDSKKVFDPTIVLDPSDRFEAPGEETVPTLIDVLHRRAVEHPDRIAYRFLLDGEEEGESFTFAELDRRARALAVWMREAGVAGGERALLLYPPGIEFISAFLGCLYAGVIAVPAYPPRANRPDARLQAIAEDAGACVALTTPAIRDRAQALVGKNPLLSRLQWVATEEIGDGLAGRWARDPEIDGETIAFLQYTSGSTATPKGVAVRHGNLVHNERMIQLAFGGSESTIVVGWLPLYHDMGLIGNVLQPLWAGATCVLMAPVAFLQQPVRWLKAISRYRANTSGGPNFAYELCVNKIRPEEREGLDLSCWKVAYNGAEPVRAETLARFAEAFGPQGFRREAFYPCYGLAEATLFVAGGERGAAPPVREVDAASLERGLAKDAAPEAAKRRLVSCGRSWLGQEILIVDPETRHLRTEGEVGEIWVAGPSVAGSYWNRPEETEATFGATLPGLEDQTWLRTGDLGFLAGGELFVTGRAKELIIVRGRNLYPQDVERTAEASHAGLRAGCGAAFSVEVEGEERLVVVQEVERDAEKRWAKEPGALSAVAEAVRRAVAEEHEAAVHAVVLVRTGTVPKTSSGKIRRRSCREDFLAGRLEPVAEARADAVGAGETAAPRTPAEARLERIWAEVLGRERVGVDQDLFALGGDSLRAIQLLARVNEAFGTELPLEDLFAASSIEALARALDSGAAPAAEHTRLGQVPRDGAPALSFAQRRLWFLHQLDPENPVHNIAASAHLAGRLDVPALSAALSEIVRRHEALRTAFGSVGQEPVQVVRPAEPLPLPVIDLSGVSREEARRLGGVLARLPFAIERGPFLRAALLRLGAEEHELVLALHHIASDGGSLGVLVREMGALYAAFAEGRPSPLPELAVQYADFAVWQRERLSGPVMEAGLAFWRERLAGGLPVLELPADRPRPAVLSHRGAHFERRLPVETTARLEAIARAERTTPFMALLAGFETLLHRYSGVEDLVVGTPIDGRGRVELEGLIGVFINNLVLRTRLDSEGGFRALLGKVKETAVSAYAHAEVPFERLVDELRPERDLSRTPLFQILIVGQNAPLSSAEIGGLSLTPREIDLGAARFDLALSLAETDGGWLGTWKYSTDLFDAPTVARWAGHFENLLFAAVEAPDAPVSRLSLLGEAERHQVVAAWNDTRAAYRAGVSLHGLIGEQAARSPEAVAVQFGEERLSYADLWDRAGQLAAHLRSVGARPDGLVGICAERSIEMVVGLLGILRAGAAYVPVDPSYPADRIAYMLADSGVPVLLTQERLAGGLPEHSARVVLLDGDWPAAAVTDEAAPESAAYAIYTSGSTGRPKGAAVPHQGIVNRLLWMQEAYGLDAEDRVLQKTPFSFDVSVWEFFWPLLTGARLVVAPPGAHQDAARLAGLIREHGITTLHFVPSMLQIFLDQEGLADACRSVKRVFASGEALPFELKEKFLERLPGAALHNLYGPTEASVDVTYHACAPGGRRRVVPIGRPVANTSIVILDRHFAPVPVGVAGELLIGGVQLARGYVGRPELTAERFVPDPTSEVPGARLYRTGDLARFRPDGEVEFLGRLDHQVKIRGVRIELGEVESALAACPGVREAVVVARDARLVAYVVAEGGAEIAVPDLRAALRGSLPEAMMPSAFVVLPALPLNPSGKVDRRALPAPEADRADLEKAYVAPRTELERRLAAMWSELLKVPRVGIHDNFFELGGDSIQGAMFVNRLQKEMGRIVYVMTLFDAPTVAELAAALAEAHPAARLASADEGVEELRAAVARRLGRETLPPYAGKRLPRAVVLLSPFRSGSTLLRVMLAGHPGLFAPPELELLAFDTMGQRRDAYSGRNAFAREGFLRAVMELEGCDADAAREIVGGFEERDLSVADAYAWLSERAGGRLIVDKTPSYALDRATLARAEEMFEAPLYVHLVRHPRATVRSYVEARMDLVYSDFPYGPETQGELVWLLGHRNALEFLARVPAERQHRLLFEDLVKDPKSAMEGLSRFLGVDFTPAMLDPYEGERMTDGLHAGTRMMGDPKFHQHRGIDASVADRWKEEQGSLTEESRALAAALGYEDGSLELRAVPRDPGAPLPLSFSQERLWFLGQLDPGSPAYNMPAAVLLEGALDAPALARSFAEVHARHEVLRTVFPAVQGQPAPVVRPAEADAPIPMIDLSALPEEARLEERSRIALEEGRRPFDLAAGPVLRTALVKTAPAVHVLLVTLHHIASDGWTIGILIRELGILYRAFSQRLPSPLAPLPLQYADYAAWQRRWLAGAVMEGHLAYWKRRLAGRLPALEMPTDRPRPAVQTFRGARVSRTIASAATEEARAWSQREGGTLFLTLLSAFNTLLHRYTAQEDLLLGIPIANRNRLETEGLIGFFLNMVVQRTDASGDPAFRELLSRVKDGFLGSTPHQEVPFERLVEAVQPERDLGRAPIFQVQFSLQNTPTESLELPGLNLRLLENHNRTTKFDFTVFLFDNPEGLTTTLEYNVDLWDASTMERLLAHWDTVLTGSVAQPGLRLSDLPLLTPGERAQLLTEGKDFVAEPALHRIFEARAAETPDAVAVVYDVGELTYRRLNERANRLAHHLRALGVGPEVPVGLCVERSLDLVVGLLGILKAGGAYVPLDPAYPAERLSWILEDALLGSVAPVLVTQNKLVERFESETPFRVVRLDGDRAALAAESAENLPGGATAENMAYVIYTSGSTGRPKGVPVPHGNVVRLFEATKHWFDFGPGDVWTMFHSFAFDFSVWEIWGALLHGGRLVVVPRETAMSPAAFYDLLVTEGVTVLNQTPSAFRQIVKVEEDEAPGRLALRSVIFGGEALDLAALGPWLSRHGDAQPELINMYGITETTVHVTWRRVVSADLEKPGVSPVGGPMPDLTLHVLGRRMELLPVGVPGEIHVGGAGLARGYLNRPELTAERFVPDPFSGKPGARLYKSGDLARRRPDGDLEYLGRIDGQVKIRGFRIEVGEIEAALHRHPGVHESVVMALPDGSGGRRLVAWVVGRGAQHPSIHELREHLQESLPEYMVPAAFLFLEKLPLTSHGKVDRKSLPDPGDHRPDLGAAVVAPRTPAEARLAQIWREILRLEEVGIHDNFFELGGHSLLVAQLASRVRAAFGVELPLLAVFEAPTLAALAARLPEVEEEPETASIPRAERGGDLPLSFAQERLWFLDQLQPGSPLYNIPVALRAKGRLSVPAFEATFREIVRRHESLRTSFAAGETAPVQVIAPEAPLSVPVFDLSALPSGAREAELARLAEEEARQPFDLGRPPLLRVALVRLSERDHVVLTTVHHIVSDGWSMGVLVREVGAHYEAFLAGRPSPLPALPIQYPDFAVWQRGWLAGEVMEAEIAHWREALAGAAQVLDLPADRPRPPVQSFRGLHLPVSIPGKLLADLRATGLRDGATLFMVLLAGFEAMLHRYTGQDDFLVGSPVANRTRREVEDLIGFFVNTLALRAPLGGEPSFRELVERVKATTLAAYTHQDLPFEKLVEALEPARDLSRAPLFQVLFVLQNAPLQALALPELSLAPVEVESGGSKFDLTLSLLETEAGLGGFFEFATALFDEATAHRMMGHLTTLLADAAAAPDRRIAELALLGPAERRQLLADGNGPRQDLPEGTVWHLVAEQARRTPNAVAVAQGAERLTYADLVDRAVRLGRRLRGMGVEPETRVGISMERSPAMVVAVLGVMASGGAYVPLDPSHPRERRSLILEAARPRLVLEGKDLELPDGGDSRVEDGLSPDNLAYVIFTSGSTGRPKGVQVTHRALLSLLLSLRREPGITAEDVVLAVTTLSFDIAGVDLLLPLLAGARIELASREEARDASLLAARLASSGATMFQATPATWRMLLDAGWEGDGRLTALSGGEALSGNLAARLLARVGALWNLYGPTETTIYSTGGRVAAEETGAASISIGRAIANTRISVLDRGLQPVPVGVPGELAIGGLGLARGYLGAPDLTAERFLPDPSAGEPGARMYRTGDLVRWLPDGRIDFLGRIDFQVKVRGFRIELGEIEAALASHPAVRQAVAGLRGDAADRRLVAWVTARGEAPAPQALREHLLARLPEYMVPASFAVLDAFPLSPSGKVDRKALPDPERGRAEADRVAPRDPVEELIAAAWTELLGVERVSVDDNFFALGGHSLLAAQLASRLRRAFGVEIPVRRLFEAPTVARLAEAVRAAREGEGAASVPPIVPVSRQAALPLSFSQERLWFLDQLEPGSPLYNIPFALRLRGDLSIPALVRTFQAIVRRHEALRTGFAEVDGVPVQVIAEDAVLDVPVTDLSASPGELQHLAAEEARQPFDLGRPPLLRVRIVRLGEGDHAVLAAVHHIVSDGWSLGVLVREVAALYRSYLSGSEPGLPELPVQYADFAAWQRGWLAGETLEAELAHWERELAGAPLALDLPTDRPRPPVQGTRGGTVQAALPAALTAQVKSLAAREGATLFMTLLSGFTALLARYSGQESFLVGTPVANRGRQELEDLIGFFVNTLALPARVEGEPDFRGLVGRVRETTLSAFAHAGVPFEKLVERLEPARDLSRPPLFQVMFVLQNAPFGALGLPGLTLDPMPVAAGTSRFDLTLSLAESGGGLAGSVEYAADLFEEATVRRFLGHFETLLAAAVADPGLPVGELSWLPEAERRQVLHGWNDTAAEVPEIAAHELFELQARRAPDAVAVSQGPVRLTYAELDRRATAFAARLAALGVGPEERVGISLERTLEMVVVVLGVLKSGGSYVPLDPSHPQERLALILEAARPRLVITEETLGDLPEPGAWTAPAADPRSTAYTIFTSGSTGRPKGVQVPHRALVNFLLAMREEPGIAERDVLLAVTTLSFDIAGLELLLPLIAGARVEIATREEAADPARLAERLTSSGATVMQATPATWRMLVDAGWEGDGKLKVLCGGEALPAALAAALLPKVGALWNVYGPTETTIWSAARRVTPEEAEGGAVLVGGAIANTQLYVLDRKLEPVPVGVPGELAIGGLGLARGYLDGPDLTAGRFVPDPFGQKGERIYRTGDLVRWRPDGRIEFLGRIDFQVKVRGFRIELGEIEAALLACPGVRQAVAGVRGEGAERRLVAWLVADGSPDFREVLKARLPEFMIPSAFVVLPAFPLSPSGKVDRKALPEPEASGAERAYVAPRNPTEELIAGIWEELLGVSRVGAEDSFFELGGHSLLATRLLSRLRKAFGVELPVRRLFEAPTVALLARAVEGERRGEALPAIVRRPRVEAPRLSFAQERLWFLDRLNPGSSAYNIPIALKLEGELDVPALVAALREIVRRHEALRTTFVQVGGEPRQAIASALDLAVPVVDLRGRPEAEVLQILQAEAGRPFDLENGPLVRALLLRVGESEWRGLLNLHHIVADGWSTDVILKELAALYAGRELPELPIQYADFAEWQREQLQGAEMGWWRERLSGAPPLLDLPADRPRPAVQRYRGRDVKRVVSADVLRKVTALGRAEGATLFMTLLAAFETLLARYTGREDLVVGTPVAGRNRLETEDLIGLFLNSLALRTGLHGDPEFREALFRTRETVLGAFAHQDLPFEKLVEELAPERNLSHAPVYQVMLVLQNFTDGELSLPGVTLSRQPLEGTTAKLDLTINAQQVGGELYVRWLYNRDLFDETTVARLAGHFERLLEAAAEAPGAKISELPLLTLPESRQLLDWNATAVDYPAEVCLHELIAAQVERTPDRPAVTFEGTTLTYRELDAAAARLAHRLAGLGVGPDVPVGVFAERSLEMVVALLAILKAGGAYLPVDPDYPADRVAFMIADSRVPVILAQEHLVERLPEHGARVVLLNEEAGGEGFVPVPVSPASLAYVIYTSGSTGRPKGTMNSHRGIVNRLLWMQEQYGLTPDDKVLQKTPFSFDVSVWEFFWPLLTGAQLVVARPGGHQDPAYLVETIASQGITTLHFVPSMLQVFVEAPGVERCTSLQRVICSGEALPLDLAKRFQARLSAGLHNLYGPTEAAVDVTYWACDRETGRASVPIGRPVANTQIWILDRNLRPVPVGVPGELHIGGIQLARGYLARPELTAEKFIPDPFAWEAGARLYRTGDLARVLPDGAVDFLGRIDHQVKVRGLRIELGEIEAALAAHPAIREAVVLARSDGKAVGDVRLVAYVAVREGLAAPELPELRTLLAKNLPEHMIPTALVVLPAMPLSPNGKADRKALAAIAPEAPAASAERVAPRNDLERFLHRLFAETLRTEDFGVHESFFDLGGNSITGALFVNRLQQELGEIVHVVTIFDHPTVAGLAEFLAAEYPKAGARKAEARPVDEAVIAEVDRLVRKLGPIPSEIAALPKNPPAVFVLSPPRSGSTLLRVMLAGHPGLFAPPELELLNFDTMPERRDGFPGRDAFRLEGLLRAVMEARGCGADEARELVEGFERDGLSTREMYARLQEWIGGRTLVDKTPTYAWDREALRRAEAGFEGARYLHLVRHPLGMVKSFEEARIDQIFFHEDHSFTRREVAEALWATAQRNTLDFLAEIPAERRHTVVFEELLRDPETVLRGICDFLGISYHPAMAEPYRDKSARMTDGLHAESRMLGDVKFHQHGRVDSGVAERWREEYREEYREESLGAPARALAIRLGYKLKGAIARIPAAPGEPRPVSFSQERFWFLERLDPGQATYNIPSAVRLTGRLDLPALESALNELVRRQESLRTTFAEQGGRPVQVIHPPAPVPLPRIDLSGLSKPAAEAEARRLAAEDDARGFDLARGPLFRVTLLALADGEHGLLLTMHHIVSDGWSIGVFLREMGALYLAFAQRQAPSLPEPPVQYSDFARWQRETFRGEALEAQLGYWRGRLDGLKPLDLPVDRTPVSEKDFRSGARLFTVSPELTDRLKALAAARGVTLYMLLLAAFQAFLARHTGQDDVAVGSPVAGRNRAETEGLIGFFVNTLVLRGDLSGDPAFADLLARARETALGAFAHQDVPFALLVEALRPERRLGRSPLVDVLFSLQNQPVPTLELPGLTLGPLLRAEDGEGGVATSFSLSLMLWESGGGLSGGFGFNTALFDGATLERWRDQFLALLAAVAEHPERRLSEVFPFAPEVRVRPIPAPAPEPERPVVAEVVAKERNELAGRKDTLSASKRELLEKRLRGLAGGAKAAPATKEAKPAGSPSPLVRLQPGEAGRPPFFCVHAIGGSVFSYGELARALGPGQPFYGIQAPGLEGGKGPVGDVSAMAAEYVAAIKTVEPDGPYYLGGWSFGGVVAVEMARQLREQGREVALLALFDAWLPQGGGEEDAEVREEAELLRLFLRDQAGLHGAQATWPEGTIDVSSKETVQQLLARARQSGLLKADVRPEQVDRLLGVYKANLQAFTAHRPRVYPGRITLFRPEAGRPGPPANGWGPFSAEPVEVRPVAGDHYSMLAPPQVRTLAEQLQECIEGARETAGALR